MTDHVSLPAQGVKTSRAFHIQIAFGTAFTFLTGGVFLSGFAMHIGASDLLVSYISMITNICGVSILFFSGFIGCFHSFKKITISLTALSKSVTLLIVLIPMFVPREVQITVFVPLMVAAFTLQAQATQERPCLCAEAVDLVLYWRNTVYGVIQ